MAARDEHSLRWKEICTLSSRIQFVVDKATHGSVSRETLENIKRSAVALVECLDEMNGDEPTFLPGFASLSCTDTPPSSPVSLSPSSSPRVPPRDVSLRNSMKELCPPMDISSDIEPRMFLPPINTHVQHTQTAYVNEPLYQSAFRRTTQAVGIPPRNDPHPPNNNVGIFTHFRTPQAPQANPSSSKPSISSFSGPRSHSFIDNTNSHLQGPLTIQHPTHPNYPNQHIPRSIDATLRNVPLPYGPYVVTQPIATICEVPGFKRRGRPSTRIDNRCVECGTQRTPEWRRGEGGVHLCNACGLQYSKRVRREKAEKKRNAITAVLNLDV